MKAYPAEPVAAWFAHMRFCQLEKALAKYEAAKTDLEKLTDYAERRCARFEGRADHDRSEK